MNVLLSSHGSTGDVFPLIALGAALNAAGHRTTFATGSLHRDAVEEAGLRFAPLPPDMNRTQAAAWMASLQRKRTPLGQLREIYRASRPHLAETAERLRVLLDRNDLLVFSYLFPFHGQLARERGIPSAAFAFAHNSIPSPDYPPEGFPIPFRLPPQWRRAICRALWKVAERTIDTAVNRILQTVVAEPPISPARNFFSHPADLVLVAVSPALMRPDAAFPERFRFTGYCRWQRPAHPAMETELAAFTGGQPVPVLTFGSMAASNPGKVMRTLARHWPRDKKLMVQRGWAEFPPVADAPHIRVIGDLPHDQLFRHASVVIHHGGAGVTASALHAGIPQLIVPHIADQNFFGREMERLGVGRRLPRKRWPRLLARAVAETLADSHLADRAQSLRRLLLTENGPADAVRELEAYVRQS